MFAHLEIIAKGAPTEADATVSGHNPKKRRESFAPRPSSPPVVVQNFSLSSARANLKVSRLGKRGKYRAACSQLEKKPDGVAKRTREAVEV